MTKADKQAHTISYPFLLYQSYSYNFKNAGLLIYLFIILIQHNFVRFKIRANFCDALTCSNDFLGKKLCKINFF